MDKPNTTSCIHCENNTFCKPYKDVAEAIGGYGLITKSPGKVWDMIVVQMAQNCKRFKAFVD
jgi:hypothetical protein